MKGAEVRLDDDVLRLVCEVRGASAESIFTLVYSEKRISHRTAMRHLARLVSSGDLKRVRLRGSRSIYILTGRSLRSLGTNGIEVRDHLRRAPASRQGDFCWLRSSLRAAVRRDGFRVGCGVDAMMMLRRSLVDRQLRQRGLAGNALEKDAADDAVAALREHAALQVPTQWRCTSCLWRSDVSENVVACPKCSRPLEAQLCRSAVRCNGCGRISAQPMPHADPVALRDRCMGRPRRVELGFDVAWKTASPRSDGKVRVDAMILFVDNPSRTLRAQLEELPLGITGQVPVPIVIRSVDPETCMDSAGASYANVGPRHREMLRAFTGKRGQAGVTDDLPFAFSDTAKVLRVFASLHVHS